MSWRFVRAVLERSRTKGAARLLLLALAEHANDDGVSFAGAELLGAETGLDVRRVRGLVGALAGRPDAVRRYPGVPVELRVARAGGGRGGIQGYAIDLPETVTPAYAALIARRETVAPTPPNEAAETMAPLPPNHVQNDGTGAQNGGKTAPETVAPARKRVAPAHETVAPVPPEPFEPYEPSKSEPKEPRQGKTARSSSPAAAGAAAKAKVPDVVTRDAVRIWCETYAAARPGAKAEVSGPTIGAIRRLVKLADGNLEKLAARLKLAAGLTNTPAPWPFDKPGELTVESILRHWTRLGDALAAPPVNGNGHARANGKHTGRSNGYGRGDNERTIREHLIPEEYQPR